MNPELTRIIEHYLNGELSESDKAVFEQKLSESDALRAELELQKTIHEGAKRSFQRQTVKQTGKHYHFRKKLIKAIIATSIAGAVAAAGWLVWKNTNALDGELSESEMTALIQQLDKLAPMEFVPNEYFELSEKDTAVLSENGVLLSVPEGAFLLNGKVYSGRKIVQWQEAMDASTIVKGGLSTMSGDRLLETQGMFGIQAFTPEGKKLQVNPKVGVYVQVPVDEIREGMQLFEGKPGKNGMIDWQNPQPLEKLPVLADMRELDFYPPGYEAKLNELKWKTGKKVRDSLYLSFEEESKSTNPSEGGLSISEPQAVNRRSGIEYPQDKVRWHTYTEKIDDLHYDIVVIAELDQGWYIVPVYQTESSFIITTKFGLQNNSDFDLVGKWRQPNGTIKDKVGVDFEVSRDLEGTVEFRQKIRLKRPGDIHTTFPVDAMICDDKHCLPPYRQMLTIGEAGGGFNDHIPPSQVLTFWNPKFNNTILATRDFEKRMRVVHNTCCKDVLEKYTNNLNKPLYEIDQMLVEMGYTEFSDFAAERVGGIQLDNPHMNNLAHFYDQAVSQLKEQVKKDKAFLRKLETDWDRKLRKERSKETDRTVKRNAKALQEEYKLNLNNVYEQLGKPNPRVFRQLGKTVGFQIIGNSAIYNIDKYVMDATIARQSTTITDATTGKTAQITYNDFSVSVDKPEQYERLFLYLFPKELHSFQRIDPKGKGVFDYPLNNDIQYDLAVIGINESDYFIYRKTGLNKGALGTVSLEKVSETTFNAMIEELNSGRNKKPMSITNELKWLAVEKEDYKVQRLRKEQAAFRSEVRSVVFPCDEMEMEYPIDTLAK